MIVKVSIDTMWPRGTLCQMPNNLPAFIFLTGQMSVRNAIHPNTIVYHQHTFPYTENVD